MKNLFNVMALLATCSLISCSKDNIPEPEGDSDGNGNETPDELVFKLTGETDGTSPHILVSDEQYTLTFQAENMENITTSGLPEDWTVTVDEEKGCMYITTPSEGSGESDATLQITATGTGEQTATENVDFHYVASFDNPEGAFLLNEGNMTTENGSLIYITPQGYVVDNAYKRVNGTELGNVTQDMYFYDGKIYIISQNGGMNATGESFENDGMLVVADAATLKKVRNFTNEELTGLDWPTHIAVIDEQHVYIRDNKGVWRLNMDDVSLTFVEGSDGAPKSQFAVTNGEVYFPLNKELAGLYKITSATDKVTEVAKLTFWMAPTMINRFLGVAATDDGNLWIMGSSASNANKDGQITLSKLNLNDSSLKQNALSVQPNETYNCTFAAHGNTIYYASGTSIYRASFNPENMSKDPQDEMLVDLSSLDDNARELYNGLSVHPATGHVYVNTIKGVGNFFTTNSIWEFDFDASLDTPIHRFDNYTHFPAGMFFNKNNN